MYNSFTLNKTNFINLIVNKKLRTNFIKKIKNKIFLFSNYNIKKYFHIFF